MTLAERWNGTEWTVQSTPNPSEAFEVRLRDVSCSSATACTAVGRYANSAGKNLTLAERWNGTEWTIQTTLSPSTTRNWFDGVSCTSSTVCTGVGYDERSGVYYTLAERWNGTEWSSQSTPNPSEGTEPGLGGLSCSTSTACTAVGWYKGTAGTYLALAERWNGTEWAIQSVPNPSGATENFLSDVSCASSSACMAVGYDKNSVGTYVTRAELWNGAEWSVQSPPDASGATESALYGVSCSLPVACTAVGAYESSGGTEVTLAEIYG